MVQEDIYQRVALLEGKVEDHGRKLEKQQEKNETQVEIYTILKMQVEVNKEQNEQMKKFDKTLTKINENLTGLNSGMQDLNSRVTEIENNQDAKKIDLGQLAKNTILYIIPALLLAWLLIELGLK